MYVSIDPISEELSPFSCPGKSMKNEATSEELNTLRNMKNEQRGYPEHSQHTENYQTKSNNIQESTKNSKVLGVVDVSQDANSAYFSHLNIVPSDIDSLNIADFEVL